MAATKTALISGTLLLVAAALTACATSTMSSAGASSAPNAAVRPPTIVKADRLTICTTDSPPNIYFDDDGRLVGIEIDIANAMASNLGLEAELLEYSFAGLIPALQASQCDVIMGSLYIKPEREEIANFVPYLYSGTAVAISSSNPHEITGFDESLCGAKVAALNGATGATLVAERSDACAAEDLPAVEITLVDEGVLGLQQLSAGQVDAYVDTSSTVSFYAQQSDGDFDMVGEPFGTIRIGAATLKDNTELHESLSDAFTAIVEDGTYDEILQEWGMESEDVRQSY